MPWLLRNRGESQMMPRFPAWGTDWMVTLMHFTELETQEEEFRLDCWAWPACGTAEWRHSVDGGWGWGYKTGSPGERTELEMQICELLPHSWSCESGRGTPGESPKWERGRRRVWGRTLEKAPLEGLGSGRGVQKTTESVECTRGFPCTFPMSPQAAAWADPRRWAFSVPQHKPSPLPLESSSCRSNGVMKPLILLTNIQFTTRPVMGIHFGGQHSCQWDSFSPEACGFSCCTLAEVVLPSSRKDCRVINAVEHPWAGGSCPGPWEGP